MNLSSLITEIENVESFRGKEVVVQYQKRSGEIGEYKGKILNFDSQQIKMFVIGKGFRRMDRSGVKNIRLLGSDEANTDKIKQILRDIGYDV